MNKKERKLIICLLLIIIIFSVILIFKIKQNDKYDEEMYALVYNQNEEIMKTNINEDYPIKQDNQNKNKVIRKFKSETGSECAISGNITINKINISYPIIAETSMENLKIAPTKLEGPEANEIGNFCIVGHNYKNGTHFSNLKKLENGDTIRITDLYKNTIVYEVYEKYEIYPDNVECLNQNTNGKKEVTLITCATNNKKRLVIKCKEIKS